MVIVFDVMPEDDTGKLGVFLRRKGVSASLVRRLKYEPAGMMVDGRRAKTNQVLCRGQRVSITLPPDEVPLAQPEDLPMEVVYETPHAMVVNKPAGLVMHPTRSHSSGTLANAFAARMEKRETTCAFRPVGRLDANTSGLVLLAMNAYAAPLLAKGMRKTYLALVQGRVWEDGVVDAPLSPSPDSVIAQQVHRQGSPSVTEYRVLQSEEEGSLLAFFPKTGRTHQIRVHMAHIGHPLLGDDLYGGDCHLMQRHALHCARLRFPQPQGHEAHFFAPLPADMCAALSGIGLAADIPLEELTCQTIDTNV
ncbi:RluA family pseudouridine synthase [Ruminococcaceae bacterium OttesenSCG-928-I18]|nr:RluA family pseudouridine synthase [Ruminococcaceae bacterium OttesenSCG-928-I18]